MKPRGFYFIISFLIIFLIIYYTQKFEVFNYTLTDKYIQLFPKKQNFKIHCYYFFKNHLIIQTYDNKLLIYKKLDSNSYRYTLKLKANLPDIINHCISNCYKSYFYFGTDDFISVYDFIKDASFAIYLDRFKSSNYYIMTPFRYFYGKILVFEKVYNNLRKKTFCILNVKNMSIIDSITFFYPDTLNDNLFVWYTNYYNNNLYLANRYSKFIYDFNLKTKKLYQIYAKSAIIKSIPNKNFKEFFSLRYDKLIIDPYHNKLFRIYAEPNIAIGGVIIDLNSNKKIGEFVFTKKHIPKFIGNKLGVILKNNKLQLIHYYYPFFIKYLWVKKHQNIFSSNTMHFFNNKCSITPSDTLSKTILLKYIKNFSEIPKKGFFILLPVKFSCPSCISYVCKIIQLNQSLLKAQGLKCIWIQQHLNYHFEFIQDSTFTYLDTTELFYKYFHLNAFNPILVKVENHKITSYTFYKPDQIKHFIFDVLKN